MDNNIGRDAAVGMVMERVLWNKVEPTPDELAQLAASLQAFGLQGLAGILMSIRYAIRWHGHFGMLRMGHVKSIKDCPGALSVAMSVMEHELFEPLLFALRKSGFKEVEGQQSNGKGRSPYRVRFVAPPAITAHFGTRLPS